MTLSSPLSSAPPSPRGAAAGPSPRGAEAAAAGSASSSRGAAAAVGLAEVVNGKRWFKEEKRSLQLLDTIKTTLTIGDTKNYNQTRLIQFHHNFSFVINIHEDLKYIFVDGINIPETLKNIFDNIDCIKFIGEGVKYAGWGYEGGTEESPKLIRQGLGIGINYDDKSIFIGKWHENSCSGKGVLKTPQFKYCGDFKNGQCDGEGTCISANGDTYEGQWIHGLQHGQGIYIYANGNRYEGDFSEGVFHGNGTLMDCNNKVIYKGTWNSGQYVGQAVQAAEADEIEYFSGLTGPSSFEGWGDNSPGGCPDELGSFDPGAITDDCSAGWNNSAYGNRGLGGSNGLEDVNGGLSDQEALNRAITLSMSSNVKPEV